MQEGGAASAAPAGSAAASGAASTAPAAAALTTVRRLGVREFSEALCRLVTADQVTDRYAREWANSQSSPTRQPAITGTGHRGRPPGPAAGSPGHLVTPASFSAFCHASGVLGVSTTLSLILMVGVDSTPSALSKDLLIRIAQAS